MKEIIFPWNLKKHIVMSLILAIAIELTDMFFGFSNDASSIGIIGGADGPTTIF